MSQGAAAPVGGMQVPLGASSTEGAMPLSGGDVSSGMAGVSMEGAGAGSPGTVDNLKGNMGLMQKFSNLLGDTPEERADNAKIFASLVKDVGNIGKTVADSTLMQRMMKAQMGGPSVITGGSASGGVGGIPPSNVGGPVMSNLGFK